MKRVLLFALLAFNLFTFSQDLSSDKKYVKARKQADILFDRQYFEEAFFRYQKLEKTYPSLKKQAAFQYKYGVSALERRYYEIAIPCFQHVIEKHWKEYPLAKFYAALAHIAIGEGNRVSSELFQEFVIEVKGNDSMIPYVKIAEKNVRFINELKTLNEEQIPSFQPLLHYPHNTSVSPFYVNDSLIFYTMSEPMVVKHTLELEGEKIKIIENKAFDMYQGQIRDGKVEASDVLEIEELPKKDNFTTGSLNKGKDKLFFTKCRLAECEVFYSTKVEDELWSVPTRLEGDVNIHGTRSKFPNIVELEDGREVLFFSSDRNRKKSGWDLYYSISDTKGHFVKSFPLSSDINTVLDETSPHYDVPSNTLYFSSNGHPGYGGKDVFSVQLNTNFKATSPVLNVGMRVNSRYDDYHYRLHRDGVSGLLVSNRESEANHNVDQILYFKYRETFDFKRVEHEYSERKFWIIEDNETSWIYMKDEGMVLSGDVEKGTEVVYLVNSNNEVIDVAEIKDNHFEFKEVPSSEKLRVMTNVSNNQETEINLHVISEDQSTGAVKDTIVAIPVQKKELNEFKYRNLSRSAKMFKEFDESDDSYGVMVKSFAKDSLRLITSYDKEHKFYLLNLLGEYMAYSRIDEFGNQTISTLEAPRKLLFNRRVRENVTVHLVNHIGDTISVFSLKDNPSLFAFLKDEFENSEKIRTKLSQDGMMTFTSYLEDYSVGGEVLPNSEVILLNITNHRSLKKTSSKKGEFSFEGLKPEMEYSLVVDEESSKSLRLIEFKNAKGEVVHTIKKEDDPRFFNYRSLSSTDRRKYHVNDNKDESSFGLKLTKVETQKALKNRSGIEIKETDDKILFQATEEDVVLKGKAAEGTKVYLYDENDQLLTVVNTNENGVFEFKKLPVNQSLRLELESNDESAFKGMSFIKEGEEIEVSDKIKMFKYRNISVEQSTKTLYDVQDESSFDFSKVNFGPKTTIAKETIEPVVEEVDPKMVEKKVEVLVENDEEGVVLVKDDIFISDVQEYLKTLRSQNEYFDFIQSHQSMSAKGVYFMLQIFSVNDPSIDPKYELRLIEKEFAGHVEQKGKGVFLKTKMTTLKEAEDLRKLIVGKYEGKFHPIIVIYRNSERIYSLILSQ